ncbi:MAG: hypothetical protein NVSMB3_08310 [Acidobacteriaceae bacterium]
MGLLAASLLTVVLVVYMFWPERKLLRQAEKTRVDYLQERKEAIYENLRDLRFEYLAGKHPEPDYEVQRAGLEDEAAGVLLEIDTLETGSVRRKGA